MARGVVDDAANQLARWEPLDAEFWIVPPADTRSLSAAAIRKEYSVNLLFRGAMTHDSRNVRLTLDLVDAVSEKTLATEQIVCPVDQLFRLSGLTTETMARMLHLDPGAGVAAPPTQVAEAYRQYESGRAASTSRTLDGVNRAIVHYTQATELDPRFADAYSMLAIEYVNQHMLGRDHQSLEMAERNLDRSRELAPLSARVHHGAALVHSAHGRTDAAIGELRRALEIDPGDASLWLILGHQYRAKGLAEETVGAYREAIRLRPNYWTAYNWLGSFHYRRGQYAEAEQAFRFVTRIAPNQTAGYTNLGGIFAATGRLSEAVEMFRKSIELAPTAAAYSNLGNCYYRMKRHQEAAGAMEQATRMQPKEHVLWRNLGDALTAIPKRRWEAAACYREAARLASEQLTVKPTDTALMSSLALYRAKIPDAAGALAALRGLEKARVEEAETLVRAAAAYELSGKRATALERLEAALRRGYPERQISETPEFDSLRSDPAFDRIRELAARTRATSNK